MSFATSHSNDFYITLPSNSSHSYFPDNTPASFRTRLAAPVQLKGKWEVALAEIHYPHTWFTVAEPAVFTYYDGSDVYNSVVVNPGFYDTLDDVFEEIKGKLGESVAKEALIDFRYFFRKHKVEVELKKGAEIWWDNKNMAQMFGSMVSKSYEGKYLLDAHVNWKLGPSTLYIYTDIISPVLVGDSSTPLLKTVPVSGDHGEIIAKTYRKLHYVPLSASNFQTTELNISDVIVKLHFRPRRLAYM